MNKSKGLILVLAIAIITALSVVSRKPQEATAPTQKEGVQVQASFYPIAYFAKQIVGDEGTVTQITETGIDPHNFSLSPSQRITLQTADVFLYNGAELDPWAEELAPELSEAGVIIAEMADTITLLEHEEDEHEDEMHAEEEEDEHGHGGVDPHFWIDPVHAQTMVDTILNALIEVDQEHQEVYTARANDLKQQLNDLDFIFTTGLSSCSLNEIIVAHDAYGYLSERYGFTTHAIAGLSPDAEPSAKTFGELETLAREENIQYIFFEELTSPRLSETLANDIGAETLVLSPVANLTQAQIESGETYFTLMQRNLENLQTALQCS